MSNDISKATASTSRMNGIKFNTYNLFAEGHKCNALEAKALSDAATADVRLSFSVDLAEEFGSPRELKLNGKEVEITDARKAELQEEINKAYTAFEFSESGHRGRTADPVMQRAMSNIRSHVTDALLAHFAKEGIAAEEVTNKVITAQCKKTIGANPALLELARKQLEEVDAQFTVEL